MAPAYCPLGHAIAFLRLKKGDPCPTCATIKARQQHSGDLMQERSKNPDLCPKCQRRRPAVPRCALCRQCRNTSRNRYRAYTTFK